MTEEQIECSVERRINAIDKSFLTGAIGQAEYDRLIKSVDAWASAQYERKTKRVADRIDGYDRDDLGESPDY
jgi:hypothetical protein